ncbi:MAG: pilin [Gammaproteobacteria bacterium]|nr:pilin [Gammaproteobacteria bacterium]
MVNSFQVVITNQLKPDQDKNLITEKLAILFKIDAQKAAQLLIKPRTVIKDNLDEATARKYLAAIQQTGAHCELINTQDAVDLPQIVDPPKSDSRAPQPGAGTRASAHTHQDAPLSLVAREEKTEKETREKLLTLRDASDATLCPDCGTIRGSVDAICLHCGYNPFEFESQQASSGSKKSFLIAGVILLLLFSIGAIVALPHIQKFMLQHKINQDLALAFDIRNQVSEFIVTTSFFPNQNIDANLPNDISNDTIESIIVSDNGVLTVTLRAEALKEQESQTLIFVPRAVKGVIAWNCLGGTLRNDLRPEFCRNSLSQ